jgi:hypothetical protein
MKCSRIYSCKNDEAQRKGSPFLFLSQQQYHVHLLTVGKLDHSPGLVFWSLKSPLVVISGDLFFFLPFFPMGGVGNGRGALGLERGLNCGEARQEM